MNQNENIEIPIEGVMPVVRKINALWLVRQEIDVYSYYFSHTEQDIDHHTRRYLGEGDPTTEEKNASRDTLIDYRLDELIPIFRWNKDTEPRFFLSRQEWHNLERHLGKNYSREYDKLSEDRYAQKRLVLDEMGAFAITQIGLFDLIGDKRFDIDLSMAISYLIKDITDDSSRSVYDHHKTIEEKTAEFREQYTKLTRSRTYDRKTWWRQVRDNVASALRRS